MLHRIHTDKYGFIVTPTMSFDERGHKKNHTSYFVYGEPGEGKAPEVFAYGEKGNWRLPDNRRIP